MYTNTLFSTRMWLAHCLVHECFTKRSRELFDLRGTEVRGALRLPMLISSGEMSRQFEFPVEVPLSNENGQG